MRIRCIGLLAYLVFVMACQPIPEYTKLENEKSLKEIVALTREKSSFFDHFELISHPDFENALLIEHSYRAHCCRGTCRPMTMTEKEDLASDFMFSGLNFPETESFDGVVMKLTQIEDSKTTKFAFTVPSSRFP